MTHSEKVKAISELLLTRALLSQKPLINLLLRDLNGSELETSDLLLVLTRLQEEGAVKIESISPASNTNAGHPLRVFEAMFQGRADLEALDKNLLTTSDILEIRLLPPFSQTLKQAGVAEEEVKELQSVLAIAPHPVEIEIYCPTERSVLCKIKTEDEWREIQFGKVFYCKDRRHAVEVMIRGEKILLNMPVVDLQKVPKQIDTRADNDVSLS